MDPDEEDGQTKKGLRRQNALKAVKALKGLRRRLVGFEVTGRGIARHGYPLCDKDGKAVGICTSGSPGPTVGKNIGLGYLPGDMSAIGTQFLVDCRRACSKVRSGSGVRHRSTGGSRWLSLLLFLFELARRSNTRTSGDRAADTCGGTPPRGDGCPAHLIPRTSPAPELLRAPLPTRSWGNDVRARERDRSLRVLSRF